MIDRRSYHDGCAAAHALDLIGARWALLVVRELLFGPKRFTDLQAGLPTSSPNVLSQRLRELEELGVVRRWRLGPPVGGWVYELTEWGAGLGPVVAQLGAWGRRSPFRDRDAPIGPDSVMLALQGRFDPVAAAGLEESYEFVLDEHRFAVRATGGRLDVVRGEAPDPAATVRADVKTLSGVLAGRLRVEDAVDDGRLKIIGDPAAFARLLGALAAEEPASVG